MHPNILLVDTPTPTLTPLANSLREAAYAVTVVDSEAQVLSCLQETRREWQLIFIHLALPHALATCDALRNTLAGALVPTIFIGSLPGDADSIRSPAAALQAGADYYFAQPLQLPQILAKVQTYVGLQRQQTAAHAPLAALAADARAAATPAPPASPSSTQPLAGAADLLLAQINCREAELQAELSPKQAAFFAAVQQPLTPGPAPWPSAAASSSGAHAAPSRPNPPPINPPSIAYQPLTPAFGRLGHDCDMAKLLCMAQQQGVTGRLSFENGHAQSRLFLLDGQPVHIQSLFSHERLEEYLYKQGQLDATQYQQVRLRALRRSAAVQAFIREKNFLSAEALRDAMQRQLQSLLLGLFQFSSGSFSYAPQLCEPSQRLTLTQDVRCSVMQAIRQYGMLPQLLLKVGDTPSRIALYAERQAHLEALQLRGAELTLLSWLDGQHSLQQIIDNSGLAAQSVYQVVYGLLCVGAAQHLFHQPLQQPHATWEADFARNAQDTQLIGDMLQQVRMQDYLQILQVTPQATSEHIEAAFSRLYRQFSAAAFAPAVQIEQQQSLQEIQTVLKEAYDVLSDLQLRHLYSRHVA